MEIGGQEITLTGKTAPSDVDFVWRYVRAMWPAAIREAEIDGSSSWAYFYEDLGTSYTIDAMGVIPRIERRVAALLVTEDSLTLTSAVGATWPSEVIEQLQRHRAAFCREPGQSDL